MKDAALRSHLEGGLKSLHISLLLDRNKLRKIEDRLTLNFDRTTSNDPLDTSSIMIAKNVVPQGPLTMAAVQRRLVDINRKMGRLNMEIPELPGQYSSCIKLAQPPRLILVAS